MGAFDGTVEIPKVGKVKKVYFVVAAGGLAAYVLWSYWRAAGDTDDELVDPAFGEGEVLPTVPGAYSPGGGGIPDDDPTAGTETYGFRGTTNSQWTQYVSQQLAQSERWDYQTVVAALGRYLANQTLDGGDQEIVQAAIALAGRPPQGSFTIKPGGETPITVAPTGVKATAKNTTTLNVTWNAVPGAHEYRLYRAGVAQNVGTSRDTKAEVGGLQPGNSYTVYVRAVTASGKQGPRSAGAKGTTKNVTLKAPTGLRVVKTSKTAANLTWRTVSGADGYRMYHNRASGNVGASGDGKATVYGLKPNTTYRFHVRALDHHGNLGPKSAQATGKTKK